MNSVKDYLRGFPELSPHVEKFSSIAPRGTRTDAETSKELENNNNFELPFILPSHYGAKSTGDLVIMVNGYNSPHESLSMFFSRDFGICPLLAMKGIATVVLPIPFHHWRTPTARSYQDDSALRQAMITARIAQDKTRFYLGFQQLLIDLEHLSKQLLRLIDSSMALPVEVKRVHLLGYSLGGLGALSAFIIDRSRQNRLYSSCTPLFSGASLRTINSFGSDVPQSELRALEAYFAAKGNAFLDDPSGHLNRFKEIRSGRLRAFKHFVFGIHNGEIFRLLKQSRPRICVIVGDKDHVMKLKDVLTTLPIDSLKQLLIIVPEAGHFPWLPGSWNEGGEAVDAMRRLAKTLIQIGERKVKT